MNHPFIIVEETLGGFPTRVLPGAATVVRSLYPLSSAMNVMVIQGFNDFFELCFFFQDGMIVQHLMTLESKNWVHKFTFI